MLPYSSSTSLTITNPLILYRTLLATKRIEPDPAQHRLAIHLQKIYHRLKDYKPEVDFRHQLNRIQKSVNNAGSTTRHIQGEPAESGNARRKYMSRWTLKEGDAEITALTRQLTAHESAINLQSPQGILLHGEVGTGKSLLIDLLADCLPNQKKRRWHFNTFMLEILAKLDLRRKEYSPSPMTAVSQPHEHSLLSLAKDMMLTSPIVFLDEFQIPDRAASKILSNFLTSFFHLGGVLIATSNRLPEELANAAGIEFGMPPKSRRGLLGNALGFLGSRPQAGRSESLHGGKGDFAAFLEVLRARCEVYEMNGSRDWRRRDNDRIDSVTSGKVSSEHSPGFQGLQPMEAGDLGLGYEQSLHLQQEGSSETKSLSPTYYAIDSSRLKPASEGADSGQAWEERVTDILKLHGLHVQVDGQIPWNTATLRVYGRDLLVPHQFAGVTQWTFDELCGKNFGPADYITLASNFHTFIVKDVPILTTLQKNEARRFITVLDALCEARCKLLMRAEAGPDSIFFPDAAPVEPSIKSDGERSGDEVYPETFSEIYQDQISPFRPNVSSYTASASSPSYASSSIPTSASQLSKGRSILADEDSDFGPVYGASREHGVSHHEPDAGDIGGRKGSDPDFSHTGAYTGEDEKFAYKRAQSRLWELCGSRWWAREGDWWRPLSKEARHWESSGAEKSEAAAVIPTMRNEVGKESDPNMSTSPFRTSQEPPPVFSWTHAWGMMVWGKKAGAWGKGPAGLSERRKGEGGR